MPSFFFFKGGKSRLEKLAPKLFIFDFRLRGALLTRVQERSFKFLCGTYPTRAGQHEQTQQSLVIAECRTGRLVFKTHQVQLWRVWEE